jgi:hypothetical protein
MRRIFAMPPPGVSMPLNGTPWRLINKRRIAHAVIEAAPVDAPSRARCVPVALMNAPERRVVLGNIFEGVSHGPPLVTHAVQLPLAIQADVQNNRVVQRRDRLRSAGLSKQCKSNKSKPPRHLMKRAIVGAARQLVEPKAFWTAVGGGDCLSTLRLLVEGGHSSRRPS